MRGRYTMRQRLNILYEQIETGASDRESVGVIPYSVRSYIAGEEQSLIFVQQEGVAALFIRGVLQSSGTKKMICSGMC